MKNKYVILSVSFVLGLAFAGAVEAGNCHGTKKATPAAVTVEQDVIVAPGVEVRESVTVDVPGDVVVSESVTVGGPVAPPLGVHATRKDARREKKATIAAAKSERKAGRYAKKTYEADHEASVQDAVKKAYDSN
jgi:hypothetical protein